MLTLFIICMSFVSSNSYQYNEHGVVPEIQIKENQTFAFPMVALCLQEYNSSVDMNRIPILSKHLKPRRFSEAFVTCRFEDKECVISDFEHFRIYYQYGTLDLNLYCYKFNGGSKELLISTFGAYSGLMMELNMQKAYHIFYYIGDNKEKPVYRELINALQPGKNIIVGFEKTVYKRLPIPYSRCIQDIKPSDLSSD